MMPAEHAPYSPSQLEHQRHCSLYRSGPSGEAAERGTEIHRHIEQGTPVADLPEDYRAPVSYAYQIVIPWVSAQMPMATLESEVRVATPIPDCWGTADLVADDGRRAVLVDWKTGHGDRPEARDCFQLAVYALGLIHMRPHLQRVTVALAELDRATFTHHTFDAVWLQDQVLGVLRIVVDSVRRGDRISAGRWCRYCEAAPTCPRLRRDIDQLPIRTAIDDLTGTALAEAMDRAEVVEAWVKAVKQRCYVLAEASALPGWTIRPGRPTRCWTDPQAAAQAMRLAAERKGVEFDPHKQAPLKSPAEAEKELGKSKAVSGVLAPYIDKKPGRPQLARKE